MNDPIPMQHEAEGSENGRCGCGWELPITPFAFTYHQVPADGSELKGAYVALRCPQCDQPHAFFGPDAASVAAFEAMTERQERSKH